MKNKLFVQENNSYTLKQYVDIVIKKILDNSTDLIFNVFYDSFTKSNTLTVTSPNPNMLGGFRNNLGFCIDIENLISEDTDISLTNVKDLLTDLIYENMCETPIENSDVRNYIRENLIVSKKTLTKLEEYQKFIRTRDTSKLKGAAKYKNVMIIVNHHVKDKFYDIVIINKDHHYMEASYRMTDDEAGSDVLTAICTFVGLNFFKCDEAELLKASQYIYNAIYLNNLD